VEEEALVDQRVPFTTLSDYEDRSASGDGYQAVVGAAGTGADVLAAHRLAQSDRAEIIAVVAQNWDEVTDPTTPSSRLLELAGLSLPEHTALAPAAVRSGTCA
jgi:hypothetical protein